MEREVAWNESEEVAVRNLKRGNWIWIYDTIWVELKAKEKGELRVSVTETERVAVLIRGRRKQEFFFQHASFFFPYPSEFISLTRLSI